MPSGSQLYSNISSEFVILYRFLNTMLIYLTKTHICLNFNKVTWKSKSLVLMSYTRQVLCSSTTANLVREELRSRCKNQTQYKYKCKPKAQTSKTPGVDHFL
jgi:hypothetical protein